MGSEMEGTAKSWQVLEALLGDGPSLCNFWELLEAVSRCVIISDICFGMNTMEIMQHVPSGASQEQGSC